MQEKTEKLIFSIFKAMVLNRSKKYGMGQVYIQGQLEEARHQLQLKRVKKYRN
jgi:hypothetical protein